jgi:hypothetical protein
MRQNAPVQHGDIDGQLTSFKLNDKQGEVTEWHRDAVIG